MSDEEKKPHSDPYVADGSQDAAVIVATNEQYRRVQQAAVRAGGSAPPRVPPAPPVFGYDGSADAAFIASWEARRRQTFMAATTGSTGPVYVPDEQYAGTGTGTTEDDFPVLVSRAVIIPYEKTFEGELIRAQTIPLLAIIRRILDDPSRMYEIDPRTWEEIIAATYEASGEFDKVTLTPRSGDYGRDVIAEKNGFGSVRLIESVKRYKPGNEVTAKEVRELLGVLSGDQQATKGVVSTTWEFAPMLREDIYIKPFLPYRLELVNGTDLVSRLKQYTTLKWGRKRGRE